MLDFSYKTDPKTGEQWIETSVHGKPLLTIPQLNKGTAFTQHERDRFNLHGKLPFCVETLEEQTKRSYLQYASYASQLQRNIYLNNLHEKNQVLFYSLVSQHLAEMLPTIYTPIVGTAVKQYSSEFRQPRGIYIAYPYQDQILDILDNRTNPEIDLIVFTDGEGVLGIGDQGIGGTDIPVAKLMVYALCGGINPSRALPIFLDVGTNNEELLKDPLYLGWRHKRIEGKDYDQFIAKVIAGIQEKFPRVFLHWEDFGRENANRNLQRYQDKLCTFNDDIQGTGAVALAALMAAVNAKNERLIDQRILVFGAGSAGTGISEQISGAMVRNGLTVEQATERFWLIDRQGLIIEGQKQLTLCQQKYIRTLDEVKDWPRNDRHQIDLLTTIEKVKPTILIGCSTRAKAFDQTIVETMARYCSTPIIFPLSNPTEHAEATPHDLMQWTKGKALIATGSPFPALTFENRRQTIAQCNNALVFPGMGLGIISVKAKRFTQEMLWQATLALAECSPIQSDPQGALLPTLEQSPHIAKKIALAVAKTAIDTGLATSIPNKGLAEHINDLFWEPRYLPMKRSPAKREIT